MSFDGLFIKNFLNEITPKIVSGKLMKIYQPFEKDLVLVFRKDRIKQQLLLSTNAQYPRFNLTDETIENPPVPPTFSMVLRKYLEGSILKSVEQVGIDRIINFNFTSHDDLGDELTLTLSFEIMNRHSNIILINQQTGKIVNLLKKVNPDENRARLLLPNATYELPPLNDQLDIFTLSESEFDKEKTPDIADFVSKIGGLDRDNRHELENLLAESYQYQTILDFAAETQIKNPIISSLNNHSVFFSYQPKTLNLSDTNHYANLNDVVTNYYQQQVQNDWVKERSGRINKVIKNELKKLSKKLKKLELQLSLAENSEDYRIKGELLNTYLHQVKPGMTSIELPNYYEENKLLAIDLKEDLSPAKNAQWYFTRYQKLKNSIKHVNEQIAQTKDDLAYFDSIKTAVDNANPEDISLIIEELENQGFIKKSDKKSRSKKITEKTLNRFVLSSGKEVLVGKNNYQNDWLSFKKANKNDLWFHVKNLPGSHVLLLNPYDENPSDEDIVEAAEIASYFSKAQNSAHIQVDYLPVRRLKKPNGAKPGFVIYTGQKSIEVTPNKDEILSKQKKS